MIQNDLKKLEEGLRALETNDPNKKAELLGLAASLRSEMDELSKTHKTISDLADSVRTFEGAHPKVVELIEQLSRLLSSIGI